MNRHRTPRSGPPNTLGAVGTLVSDSLPVKGVLNGVSVQTGVPTRGTISIRNVSKVFGSTCALGGVDLDILPGEVHGLCGANGSGKSTLVKILCGVVSGDGGRVTFADRELDIADIDPRVAYDAGVRVVHQDLAVFPHMTVAENMAIGGDLPVTRAGTLKRRLLEEQAAAAIDRFEIAARPTDILGSLPVAVLTQVAVARALRGVSGGHGLIVFDETTASLPIHEVATLHRLIRKLAAEGHPVLFISHRLAEVLQITDRITVFRNGNVTATHQTSEIGARELVTSITGHSPVGALPRPLQSSAAPKVVELSNLNAGPLRGINLAVHAGEIVGIAGLLGSGRTELLRAIYGDLPVESGILKLHGEVKHITSISAALEQKIVMIPEDRVNSAVFSDLTVDENLNVSAVGRYRRMRGIDGNKMRSDAAKLRQRFGVKAPSGTVPMSALSGGNQQKVVVARWLRLNPALMLLDEPTQGVDAGARADIYALIREATGAGAGAILVTSDLEEMAEIADKVFILDRGRLVARVTGSDITTSHLEQLLTKGAL